MQYKFSDKIASLKPSAVREILKSTADPEVIALAAGNPAPEAFPVDDIKRIASEVMEQETILALQYGVTEGYAPLIDELKAMLQRRLGLGREFDELIVTSGATQVMELLTKVLCNEGDSVAVEDPSFIGSLNAFRSYGVNLRGVPIDDDGINIEALEKTLQSDDRIRFLYVIPNFQNPSGCTMSLKKRKAVYDLACRYDIIVLEDNPYGDLRVEGEDLPCIKSFDTEGRVVYAGTFSKVISPGIRVGYTLGPGPVLAKMTVGKQTEDVHNVMFSQLLVYHWLTECDIEAHIKKMQAIYRKKRDLMCGLIDSELGDYVTYVRPEGGLFVWCRLDDRLPMMEFCRKAVGKKVAVVPGTAFLSDPEGTTQYIRLNYSTPTDDEIEQGLKLLGEVAREMIGE